MASNVFLSVGEPSLVTPTARTAGLGLGGALLLAGVAWFFLSKDQNRTPRYWRARNRFRIAAASYRQHRRAGRSRRRSFRDGAYLYARRWWR